MNIKRNDLVAKYINNLKIVHTESGYAKLTTAWHAENVCSPFSRIYYIAEGEGFLKSKNRSLRITAGNCYFIPAGMTFDYWCESSLVQIFFHVIVTEPSGLNFFSGVDGFGSFPVSDEEMKEVSSLYFAEDLPGILKLKTYLDGALYRFISQYQIRSFSGAGYSAGVLKTIKYIKNNLSVQLRAADIAADQFISKSKLTSGFKAETGMTVGKYIDELIFARAEFLLSETEQPIKTISGDLGFCDQFYFARRFKQRFGESPMSYRKRAGTANKI